MVGTPVALTWLMVYAEAQQVVFENGMMEGGREEGNSIKEESISMLLLN